MVVEKTWERLECVRVRVREPRCYVTVGTFARRGLGSLSNDTELS